MRNSLLIAILCLNVSAIVAQYKWEKLPPIPQVDIRKVVYGPDDKLYLFTKYDKTYFYISDSNGLSWNQVRSPEQFINVNFFEDGTQIFQASSKIYKYDDSGDWQLITSHNGNDIILIGDIIYSIGNYKIKTIDKKGDGTEKTYPNPLPHPKWGPYELFKIKDKYYMTSKGGIVKSILVMDEIFDSLNYIPNLPIVSDIYSNGEEIFFFNQNYEVVITDSLFNNFENKKVKSSNGYEFGITSTFIYDNELYIYNTNRIYKHPLDGALDLDWELVTLDKDFGRYNINVFQNKLIANGYNSGDFKWLVFDINSIESEPNILEPNINSTYFRDWKLLDDGNILVEISSGFWLYEKSNNWIPRNVCISEVDENYEFYFIDHITSSGKLISVNDRNITSLDVNTCEIERVYYPERISSRNSYFVDDILIFIDYSDDYTTLYRSSDFGQSFEVFYITDYSINKIIHATASQILLATNPLEGENATVIKINEDSTIEYFPLLDDSMDSILIVIYGIVETCNDKIDISLLTRSNSGLNTQLYTSDLDNINFTITNPDLDPGTSFRSLTCINEITYAQVKENQVNLYYDNLSETLTIPFEEDTNNRLNYRFIFDDGEYIFVSDDNGQIYKLSLGVLSVEDNNIYCNYSEQKTATTINWSVSNIENLSHYHIFRKSPSSQTFENISNGTYQKEQTENQKKYEDYDIIENGIHYYKVVSHDYDGRTYESKIVSCNVTKIETVEDIIVTGIYPNPADVIVNIRLLSKKPQLIQLELRSMEGKTISTTTELLTSAGMVNVSINTENINAGTYLLSIKNDDNVITNKVIITP